MQAAEGQPDEQVDQNCQLSVTGQAGRQGDRSTALRKVSLGNVTL